MRPTTISGLRCCSRALHDVGFSGPLVLASSMVVYGEGRYRCAEHGIVPAAPRRARGSGRGPIRASVSRTVARRSCPSRFPSPHRSIRAMCTPRRRSRRSTSRSRSLANTWGRTVTALRYHNVYGPGMPRDTPYAGVAALFSDALASGRPPRVFEDGGQTPRLRARLRCRPRERARAPRRGAGSRSTSRVARRADCSRWRTRSRTRSVLVHHGRTSSVAGEPAMCATSSRARIARAASWASPLPSTSAPRRGAGPWPRGRRLNAGTGAQKPGGRTRSRKKQNTV